MRILYVNFSIFGILAIIHSFIHLLSINQWLILTKVFECYLILMKLIVSDAHAWRMVLLRINNHRLESWLILFWSCSWYSEYVGCCNGVFIKKLLVGYFDVLRIEIPIWTRIWSRFFHFHSICLYQVTRNVSFEVLYALIRLYW